MKKITAVDVQLPAAQPPIGAEQVMTAEDSVLEVFECPPADQAKISHELFPFSRIGAVAGGASASFPGYRVGVRSQDHALPKAAITGTKNGPKNAIARRFRSPQNRAH